MYENPKSDVRAKSAFLEELQKRGYQNLRITRSPADITAEYNGVTFYFEIKFSSAEKNYWGAATLTEWAAAMELKERYRFVVAYVHNHTWEFVEYTPDEFMQFSTIPPFKIFFRLPIRSGKAKIEARKTKAVQLTAERLKAMSSLFEEFRNS